MGINLDLEPYQGREDKNISTMNKFQERTNIENYEISKFSKIKISWYVRNQIWFDD